VRLLAGEGPSFPAFLDRAGRGSLGAVTVDDVRGFMVEMAPRRPAGIVNVVWSLKRFFAFLNRCGGLSDVRVDRPARACRAAAGAGAAVLYP